MAIDTVPITRMLSELRTQSAEAEKRTLDELLDRICDARGAADQNDGDPARRLEKVQPSKDKMPTINLLFDFLIGVLIGVLVVSVLTFVLELVSS
jgi:hypothetical protein